MEQVVSAFPHSLLSLSNQSGLGLGSRENEKESVSLFHFDEKTLCVQCISISKYYRNRFLSLTLGGVTVRYLKGVVEYHQESAVLVKKTNPTGESVEIYSELSFRFSLISEFDDILDVFFGFDPFYRERQSIPKR